MDANFFFAYFYRKKSLNSDFICIFADKFVIMGINYAGNIEYTDFRTQVMSVDELLYRYENVGLVHRTFYRTPSKEQSSRYIETLLLGMPQQPFFVDDTESEWVIIDGMARMDALYKFCSEGMRLTSLYFMMDLYEGMTFGALSPLMKNKILNTKIFVNVLNPGLSPSERFGIYTCLKPRIDAATIRWCRSRIYREKYRSVESLARKLSDEMHVFSLKTKWLESRICYLLLGLSYSRFINSSHKHHIEAAVNYVLENQNQLYWLEKRIDAVKDVLSQTLLASRTDLNDRFIDLYNVLNYHLYNSGNRMINSSEFLRLIQRTNPSIDCYALDCAETFCDTIADLLSKF